MTRRPIRVFHLIKSLGRGGAEMLLAEGLRRADRDAFEFAYGYFVPWKDQLVGNLRDQGAEVSCFEASSPTRMLLRVPRVARALRSWRADVVHCHLPLAGVVGRLAGRAAGVPVVYTEHNLQERYHPLTRRANTWTWALQRAVVAVSEDVARSARRFAPGRVPLQVVKNGVSLDAYHAPEARARVRAAWGIPEDAVVVGTTAVFRTQKRLDLWLETAAALGRERQDLHFLLVGDGPLRAELEAQAQGLGLGSRLQFTGLQSDVSGFLAAMDVFMMSSIFEGMPVALLEAMAAGLPAVATAVGGVPEVVEDGVSGLLVAPDAPERLLSALRRLVANGEERRAMGDAARARVGARFTMDEMARSLEEIYRSVIDGAR